MSCSQPTVPESDHTPPFLILQYAYKEMGSRVSEGNGTNGVKLWAALKAKGVPSTKAWERNDSGKNIL